MTGGAEPTAHPAEGPARRTPAARLYAAGWRLAQALGLWRFGWLHPLHHRLARRMRRPWVEVHGHRLHLDARDALELSVHGTFEPLETELVRRRVRSGQTVIDVGAHIGYYALLFARQVGAGGRVFAFEPDPENFALLERNVAGSGYRQLTLTRAAVLDRSGPLTLHRSPENSADHQILAAGSDRATIGVDGVALDDFFGERPPAVDFVKMDVQGAEGYALRGMRRLLTHSPGVTLVTEFWPRGLVRCGTDPADYLAELAALGFALQEIDERRARMQPVEPAELLRRYPSSRPHHTNLLCTREPTP